MTPGWPGAGLLLLSSFCGRVKGDCTPHPPDLEPTVISGLGEEGCRSFVFAVLAWWQSWVLFEFLLSVYMGENFPIEGLVAGWVLDFRPVRPFTRVKTSRGRGRLRILFPVLTVTVAGVT